MDAVNVYAMHIRIYFNKKIEFICSCMYISYFIWYHTFYNQYVVDP